MQRAGGRALAVPTDVADHRQVEAAAEQVEQRLGPIDIWVNVAFTSVFAPFTEITPEEFRRVTEVTYLGYVYGTRAALEHMVPRDHGTIVQVGSTLAYRAIPLQSAYCGAKHAVQGFTEALRCELLHQNSRVRITMVQLPAVNTPQFDWVLNRLPNHPRPVAPVYQPEVAARAVVHAADHPGRREYWVGGRTVTTLVANRLVPGVLDRYLARTGYEAQQTDQPADPERPFNLWEPVDGRGGRDFGAHGSFDDEAVNRSLQAWVARRPGLAAAAGGLLAGLLASRLRRR
jgi:NAD(P)-dependent dehydrogenase (short-subunit alcohol dehydrogenase family)